MNFKSWFEVYSNQTQWLKQYLNEKPLHLSDHYDTFITWRGAKIILKRLNIDREELEKEAEGYTDDFYHTMLTIEKAMTKKERDDFSDHLIYYNSVEAPTWTHMDYIQQVPRNTWLVHFSKDAGDISYQGFQYGSEDMTKLGLTTWRNKKSKEYGGYNFAFIADHKYASQAAAQGKYGGGNAVLFQASGIAAFHNGDEEEQIIFWGPAISPGSIVYIIRDDDKWCVQGGPRGCLYTGKFEDVVSWVQKNHHQYRKQLFSTSTKWQNKWYDSQRHP